MECTHNGYLDKRDDEYDAMQEYFDLYLQATQLIGASYLICGEEESAASVFDECRSFIASLDFSKVRTIIYSHPKEKVEELFIHTAVPSIAAAKTVCLEAARLHDYIELTLSGEEILEVLERGN